MALLLHNQLREDKTTKKKTYLLVFPLPREPLHTFAKHLPSLLEAQTSYFISTVQSDIEGDDISDPEGDHMCDSLLVTTVVIINSNRKKNK